MKSFKEDLYQQDLRMTQQRVNEMQERADGTTFSEKLAYLRDGLHRTTLPMFEAAMPKIPQKTEWWQRPFKKLFIDIDGVIAAFEEAFSEKYNLTEAPHDWADHRYVNRLQSLREDKDFWLSIKPLVNPALIAYPISGYCTARSIPLEWIQEWLELNMFPAAPILKVNFDESKVQKLKDYGCEVFIDDSINNFVELNSNGVLCYLATRPHNTKYDVGVMRVSNLLELINRLKH